MCLPSALVTENVAAGGVCNPAPGPGSSYKLCAAGLTCKNCGEDSALYRCVAEGTYHSLLVSTRRVRKVTKHDEMMETCRINEVRIS